MGLELKRIRTPPQGQPVNSCGDGDRLQKTDFGGQSKLNTTLPWTWPIVALSLAGGRFVGPHRRPPPHSHGLRTSFSLERPDRRSTSLSLHALGNGSQAFVGRLNDHAAVPRICAQTPSAGSA